jgi:hypothetical protein
MDFRSIVFTESKNIDFMGQYRDGEWLYATLVEWVDDYDRNGDPESWIEDEGLMWSGSNVLMLF